MVSKGRMAKFQRVTALFEQGRAVVVEEDGPDGPTLIWISKLNPFEQEEARKDGQAGKARAVMMVDADHSNERAVFDEALKGRTQDDLIEALVYAKADEDYVSALDDLQALPEWTEKLLVLERGDAQMEDAAVPLEDAQRTMLAELNQEYIAKVDELLKARQQVRRDELAGQTLQECQDAYRAAYRDTVGSQAFLAEYKSSELYFAVRDCNAKKGAGDAWDHSPCGSHREKLLDSRADVRDLPEALLALIRDEMRALTMSPGEAGNSDAPASSSASSERPSAAGESTASTPTEMSPVPAGTS